MHIRDERELQCRLYRIERAIEKLLALSVGEDQAKIDRITKELKKDADQMEAMLGKQPTPAPAPKPAPKPSK